MNNQGAGYREIMRLSQHVILTIMFLIPGLTCFAGDFPYRDKYSSIPVIELDTLKSGYDSGAVLLVDVRTSIEFDTIHPKKAHNVPLDEPGFVQNLSKLADQFPGSRIAVYCNGVTCIKSYIATKEARAAGMTNVIAFDAGVNAWARAYPSDTLLLGREIVDPLRQIITETETQKHFLDFDTFKEKVGSSDNAVVIDIRDNIQRSSHNAVLPGLEMAMPMSLDKVIRNIIMKGSYKNKTLYFFDQVGRQVQWLIYYLVDQGYQDYYFLAGGATEVLQTQSYR